MGKLVNRARMAVASAPGTGTISLGAAVPGYQTFAAAGVNNGDVVSYVMEDGSAWEFGQGTYASSGTTLARTTIQGSSSSGAAIGASSGAQVYVTALASDIVLSFRNRLRNGNFAINQRSVSGTVTLSAGQYGHDGFKAGANGCTYTFTTAANGDVTLNISAGTLLQVIEGLSLPEGGSYVSSWAGSATARVYQGTATGSYAASPLAASGLTAGTNTALEFGTGTLSLAQLEPGSAPTAYERRDPASMMLLCTRYLRSSGTASGTWSNTTSFTASFDFSASPMRAAPSVTLLNGAAVLEADVAERAVSSLSSTSFNSGYGGRLELVTAAASAAPKAGVLECSALLLSAEL